MTSARRFRQSPSQYLWLALVVAVILFARTFSERAPNAPAPLPEGPCRVERVVDGDTLIVAGGTRLRLIGVDTPETVKPETPVEPWGPEATEFTKRFLADGPARLQFDRERVDSYGRMLAYVWVGEKLLNEELLKAGLARYESYFHYSSSMKRRFAKAEADARAGRRGIWSR